MSASHRASVAALLALAVAALAAGAGGAVAEDEKSLQRTVTVSASATVSAEPDLARITVGVVSEAETAREALSRNTEAMRQVIDGLKAAGIAAEDVRTVSFSVDARYSSPRDGSQPKITGYQARNDVQVTARDLKRLGEVLDQLVRLGANQMGGLSFEVSKAETLKDEARKQAVANARRRAELFASATGARVGEVVAIAEESAAPPGPRPMFRSAMAAEAVPIERGTLQLEAHVTVTLALH